MLPKPQADPKYDRLLLNPERLSAIAQDLRNVAALPAPVGEVLQTKRLDNGLELSKVRVPMGVIAVIFESRPNVTFDVFALCLKTLNACVLKGSSDAHDTNKVVVGCLPLPSLPVHADTVYLCVVDSDNNAVSFINSLFSAFGSGFTSPNTGVLLQNRGVAFSLDANHPNCIAPNKRPLHTIIPGMLTRNDKVVMPFGVMGGHYQATGHAHLLTNLLDFGMDIQESIDFPRVFPLPNGQLEAEGTIPNDTLSELARLGHNVQPAKKPIGGGQAIWIDWKKGVLTGGSDPRKDGCAMGF